MTTTDISKFGGREREMLVELLNAWNEQGLPEDFYNDEVTPMMNTYSGNVFLTNSEYQVAMMNGDDLESFYYLSGTGREGFYDELIEDFEEDGENWDSDDLEQLIFIAEQHDRKISVA